MTDVFRSEDCDDHEDLVEVSLRWGMRTFTYLYPAEWDTPHYLVVAEDGTLLISSEEPTLFDSGWYAGDEVWTIGSIDPVVSLEVFHLDRSSTPGIDYEVL